MKIYFAGNFAQMRIIEKEYNALSNARKRGRFSRMVSFFYYRLPGVPDYTGNVIKAIKKLEEEY